MQSVSSWSFRCKNIVQWRDFLRFPADKVQHLTPECRDCMESLLCDSSDRIGPPLPGPSAQLACVIISVTYLTDCI